MKCLTGGEGHVNSSFGFGAGLLENMKSGSVSLGAVPRCKAAW